jgi:hypothetical protein
MEAIVNPPSRGSRLDADHPQNGGLIPCRFTAKACELGGDGAWRRSFCAQVGREPAHLANLGEDLAQQPDARRKRIAVGFDRLDQQIESAMV